MRRVNPDLVIAGTLGALGAAMAVRSIGYHLLGSGGRIGPGFMPFVAGIALAVFSAWACVEIVVQARRAEPGSAAASTGEAVGTEEATGTAAKSTESPGTKRKVVLVFLLAVGATALTAVTGFLIAFGLLVFVLLAAVEREPLKLAAPISVAAVAMSWLVFIRLLGVPLPGGLLGLLGAG